MAVEIDIKKLFKSENGEVWDKFVPIIKNENVTKVYITNGIEEPENYNELCYRLLDAGDAEVFELHINTPGGMVDSAFMICDAIKKSKAKVVGYLTGTVASAGTIITMACDDIIVSDHISFMIHNYSAGMMGKGHEMKARQEFMDASLNNAFKTFYRGFLTEDEMEDIIDGKDLWIGTDEVKARWSDKVSRVTTKTKTKKTTVKETVTVEAPKKRGRPKKTA